MLCRNIGIKPGFPCINVCQVPREMLKTEAVGQVVQYLPRDLANVKILENNVCINSTKYLLKFGENRALYFVGVWLSTSECTFCLISVFLA